MDFGEVLLVTVSISRALIWFVGAYVVFKYGRRIPRLRMPSHFIWVGMFLAGFNSLIFTFTLNEGIWIPQHWLQSVALVLATPLLILIVGGVIYSYLNAWHLQQNAKRLESRAQEDAAEFLKSLDKH
jgi:uncharacterized membrane protein